MKRLYCNLFGIIALVVLICSIIELMSMKGYSRNIIAQLTDSEDYFINNGPDMINPIIRNAQKDDGTTTLILGDSVAHQLFDDLEEFNPCISILPSNAGVTMAGQYVIAKEYLEHHLYVTDIYLFVLPESIGRTFDTQWGYQYAVLPFIETDTLGDFDDNTIEIMKDTYGSLFMNKKIATAVDKSGINRKLYLNYIREKGIGHNPTNYYELADQYLVKLNDLCSEEGVKFHLISCPVSETKREQVALYNSDYRDSETYKVFPEYFNDVLFYPAECFGDNTHFSEQYRTREYLNSVIKDMLDGIELINVLQFE